MSDQSPKQPAATPPQASAEQPDANAIDIQRLAEKVYQLMLADVRLGRARGERNQRRRGGR
jgi:hypothetical protein